MIRVHADLIRPWKKNGKWEEKELKTLIFFSSIFSFYVLASEGLTTRIFDPVQVEENHFQWPRSFYSFFAPRLHFWKLKRGKFWPKNSFVWKEKKMSHENHRHREFRKTNTPRLISFSVFAFWECIWQLRNINSSVHSHTKRKENRSRVGQKNIGLY